MLQYSAKISTRIGTNIENLQFYTNIKDVGIIKFIIFFDKTRKCPYRLRRLCILHILHTIKTILHPVHLGPVPPLGRLCRPRHRRIPARHAAPKSIIVAPNPGGPDRRR